MLINVFGDILDHLKIIQVFKYAFKAGSVNLWLFIIDFFALDLKVSHDFD